MGYYSSLYGSLSIEPPLPWSAYRDLAEWREGKPGERSVQLVEESVTEETDTGQAITRCAVRVVPRWDNAKFYDLAKDLAQLGGAFPSVSFSGFLVRVGEDAGDVERYWLEVGRGCFTEKACLVWPDGSAVEL